MPDLDAIRARPLGELLATVASEASEHPFVGSEAQKAAWDEIKRREAALLADNQRLREALLLALNVLGDERLHPEAADAPLGVPSCLACDAIAAGEMALAEEPRA